MLYNSFCSETISRLGFGAMRLPVKDDKSIDCVELERMVDYAMSHGINYFDTAYPYHNGFSEIELCKILNKYPRNTWYLADKFPGHQIADSYNPATVFEDQLKKCGVEYFDFYLLHNINENSYHVYDDPQWGIVDYFLEQKRLGRIRHLGFSAHGNLPILARFLEKYGSHMEFCQLQINYLDWTLQDAKAKYELVTSMNIPVIVMEPVRGGRLANLSTSESEILKNARPDEGVVSWSFRWLLTLPNVKVILGGMSNYSQMVENINTFDNDMPLSDQEVSLILSIADQMHKSVPCTSCQYCTSGCPMNLDIPTLISMYNDASFETNFTPLMYIESLPESQHPSACISCGACVHACPQQIDIPSVLASLDSLYQKSPRWADICKKREELAKKLRERS